MKMATRHYAMTMHNINTLKYKHVRIGMWQRVWQHTEHLHGNIYMYSMILLALNWKWLLIGWITLFCVDNTLPLTLGNFLPIHVTAILSQTKSCQCKSLVYVR